MALKLKIIMNPSSGREQGRLNIEDMLAYLVSQRELERADIHYTQGRFDATKYARETKNGEYDYVIAVGGDGTVNEVVTGLLEGNVDVPLAIYTSGTVNDFATVNKLPSQPSDFARMLINPELKKVDCGKAGDSYFLNVLAGGVMTDVAYKVPSNLKTALGPAAYWMSAIKEIPSITDTIQLHVKTDDGEYDAEAVMFLLSNTQSVGGFRKLVNRADIADGKLDLFVLKKFNMPSLIPMLGSLMVGDITNNNNILYLQSNSFELSVTDGKKVTLDLDGEEGPDLPCRIECIPNAITLVVPGEESSL